jgi:hypothetical protein
MKYARTSEILIVAINIARIMLPVPRSTNFAVYTVRTVKNISDKKIIKFVLNGIT